MSEHLRAAREKLHGAIADIDARLAELNAFKAEEAELRQCREDLMAVLGLDEENAPAATPSPAPSTRPAPATPRSGASAPARDAATGIRDVDAANRVLALLARRGGTAPAADVHAVTKLTKHTSKRLLTELVAAKRIVQVGRARWTMYRLPGSAGAPPADTEGDRGARRGRRA